MTIEELLTESQRLIDETAGNVKTLSLQIKSMLLVNKILFVLNAILIIYILLR